MGALVADVRSEGLQEALRARGLEQLADRPVGEVIAGVVSVLLGQQRGIDETDALTAAGRVLDDLARTCEDCAGFERALDEVADPKKLAAFLGDFFRYFLVEDFMRHHWKQLQERFSNERIEAMRLAIEELLFEGLRFELDYRDFQDVDWSSPAATDLLAGVEQEVIAIIMRR